MVIECGPIDSIRSMLRKRHISHYTNIKISYTMFRSSFRRFQSKLFGQQILILAYVLDPLGFIAGYLLAPSFGVEPIIGGVYGLVAASIPMSMFVMRHT